MRENADQNNPNTKHFLRSAIQFYLDKCLGEHNMLRDLHKNTNHLQWDSVLETAAQKYADHLKKRTTSLNLVMTLKMKTNGVRISFGCLFHIARVFVLMPYIVGKN